MFDHGAHWINFMVLCYALGKIFHFEFLLCNHKIKAVSYSSIMVLALMLLFVFVSNACIIRI